MFIFLLLPYLDIKQVLDIKHQSLPFPRISSFSVICVSFSSRFLYEEIARNRILHSRIMEVQAALRCTGAEWHDATQNGTRWRRISTKESSSSPVFRVPRSFFAGLGCQKRTGRDLHADLRAGSNRLISNRFGPRRVSPPFSPFLRPLPSSPIHVHFPFFFSRYTSVAPLILAHPASLSFSFLSIFIAFPFFCRFFLARRLFAISTRRRLRKPCINDRIGGTLGDLNVAADHQ